MSAFWGLIKAFIEGHQDEITVVGVGMFREFDRKCLMIVA